MITKECLQCGCKFSIYPYEIKIAKFHNKQCRNEYQKGKHLSPKTEFKKGKASYWLGKKRLDMLGHKWNVGRSPWNKGLHTGIKPWLGKKRPEMYGENNIAWKGDNVGYEALHAYVRDRLDKPNVCPNCGEHKDLELSNVSYKYRRDLNDWKYLCAKCHDEYDRENGW